MIQTLGKKYRKRLLDILKKGNACVVGVNFNTPLSVCIRRRKTQIPQEVMTKLDRSKDKLDPNEVDEIINVN